MSRFMRVITDTASIAVTDHGGDAPVALCLHAGVADGRSWDGLAAELTGEARVLAPDRRNFGLTSHDAGAPFSPVEDALAVLDGAGVERAVVVGNSMGGRLALTLALEHPDRVSGLVLIGSAVTGAPEPDFSGVPDEVMELDRAFDEAEERRDVDEAIRLGAWLWLDGCLAKEGRVSGEPRALYADMNRVAFAHEPPGPAVEHPEQWSRLGSIAVPTAVVFGSYDLPYLQSWNEGIAAAIPSASFHLLDGRGHLPAMEAPTPVAAIVRDVIARMG